MKKLRLYCFLFICLSTGVSHALPPKNTYVTKDSLVYNFEENWRYFKGDSKRFAETNFNDSKWQIKDPELKAGRYAEKHWFKGIAWFRLHLVIDSGIAKIPMAMTMKHYGASEIYLDGKLLKSFGKIKGEDSSVYNNPQGNPFVIVFQEAGNHVIAIRYANFEAAKNYLTYWVTTAGFKLSLDKADRMIETSSSTTTLLTFVYILLLGIFAALGLIHLFLYFYYRIHLSNLFFSLFSLCLAGLFLISFINLVTETPMIGFRASYLAIPLGSICCFSLSGFMHQLFIKKGKYLFLAISIICVTAIISRFLGSYLAIYLMLALIIIVSLETVLTIIISVIKKVKGALIIGSGLFLFTFLILFLIGASIVNDGDIELNDSTLLGKIVLISLGLAILSIPISLSVYLAWNFSSVSKNLAIQLDNVKMLSQKTIEQEQEKNKLITEQNIILEQKVEERTFDLKAEKKKSDDLLLNILPAEIAEELKAKGETEARQFEMVSVLFTDFVNFTGISETLSPKELVNEIDVCFKAFDEIMERNGLEKIKTIGDAYLAVCGMPEEDSLHAVKVIDAALDIRDYIRERKKVGGKFEIRMGIHSGPLVAGIVGVKKFAYDIWGDTVNTASRMESSSEPGKINISGVTYELIKSSYDCDYRGKLEAKNKGMIDMYFINKKITAVNDKSAS